MATEYNVIADDSAVHTVADAHPTSSQTKELVVEFDNHGLTVKFPCGEYLIVDLSFDKFKIYRYNDEMTSLLHEVNAGS